MIVSHHALDSRDACKYLASEQGRIPHANFRRFGIRLSYRGRFDAQAKLTCEGNNYEIGTMEGCSGGGVGNGGVDRTTSGTEHDIYYWRLHWISGHRGESRGVYGSIQLSKSSHSMNTNIAASVRDMVMMGGRGTSHGNSKRNTKVVFATSWALGTCI